MNRSSRRIFVFKDFHPFLTRSNFAIIRKLKEIALHLKNSFKTIVLISPVMEIPAELEKEITVLNLSAAGARRSGRVARQDRRRTCSSSSRWRSTWTTTGASGSCRRRWG